MSEPQPGPSPAPFTPTSPPVAAGRGCARPALIGCGVVVVLLGVAALVFLIRVRDILAWTFHQMEDAVVAKLPTDTPQADRERLRDAFAAGARQAAKGELDASALQAVQVELVAFTGKPEGQVTHADVQRMIEVLEKFSGLAPEPAKGTPPTPESPPGASPPPAASPPSP